MFLLYLANWKIAHAHGHKYQVISFNRRYYLIFLFSCTPKPPLHYLSIPPWSFYFYLNPSLIDLPPTLQSSLLNFLQPCNHPSKLSSNLAIIPPNCPFHRAAPSKSLQSAPFLTPSFEHAPSPLYPWDKDIIRFQIYGVSVCVLNSHLAAHDHNNQVYLLSMRIMVDIFRTTNLSSYLIYPQRMRS